MSKKHIVVYLLLALLALLVSGYWYFISREKPTMEMQESIVEELDRMEVLKNLDAPSSEPLDEEEEIIKQISAPQQDPVIREERSGLLDSLTAPQ